MKAIIGILTTVITTLCLCLFILINTKSKIQTIESIKNSNINSIQEETSFFGIYHKVTMLKNEDNHLKKPLLKKTKLHMYIYN